MGKIIAVTNQKGGVGKTTTVVNLAACLAYKGKKTLIVDADPQGNSTSGLGVNKRELSAGLYECLSDPDLTPNTIIPLVYKNLSILPSAESLTGASIELISEENRESFLKNVINKVKDDYDFIIIDSPPELGILTLNVLTAADSILVPVQCEFYALEGLSQLMSTVKMVKQTYNSDLQIEGVLATMFQARTNLSIQVLDELKKFFPEKVFSTVIPRNVRLSEAPSFGQPIIKYDITSKGADAYFALAKEIICNNS